MFIRIRVNGVPNFMMPIGAVDGHPTMYNFTKIYVRVLELLPDTVKKFNLVRDILRHLVEMNMANHSFITWTDSLYDVDSLTRYGVSEELAIKTLNYLSASIIKELQRYPELTVFKGQTIHFLWEADYATTMYLPIATKRNLKFQS